MYYITIFIILILDFGKYKKSLMMDLTDPKYSNIKKQLKHATLTFQVLPRLKLPVGRGIRVDLSLPFLPLALHRLPPFRRLLRLLFRLRLFSPRRQSL